MRKGKPQVFVILVPRPLDSIRKRLIACMMILSSEPHKDRVVDRHLSKRAKKLIAEADGYVSRRNKP